MSRRGSWLAPLAIVLAVVSCADEPGTGDDGPRILTGALPDARIQLEYEAMLEADGSEGDPVWSLGGGALPPGLELDEDGIIAGVAELSGVYEITVMAEDDAGLDEVELELVVLPVALISGFGPFAGYPVNPSIEALRELDEQVVAGFDVRISELPVVWDEAWALLLADVQWLAPSLLIGTGVAGTDAMRYETTAINEQWGTDVDGGSRSGDEVVEAGPQYLYSDLPLDAMAEAVEAAGHPTTISGSAGTYLCNDIFYHVVHHAEYDAESPMVAGFVHVPPLDGSFAIEDITTAHVLGLEVIADWMTGERLAGVPAIETWTDPVYEGPGESGLD